MSETDVMIDQAAGLRRLFAARPPRVVAFTSCGDCTPLITATARTLAGDGRSVVAIDEKEHGGVGAALGVAGGADLLQALIGECALRKVMQPKAAGLRVVPAALAAKGQHGRGAPDVMHVAACLNELQRGAEFVLIDSVCDERGRLSRLSLAARYMVVLAAANKQAVTDAYSLIRRLAAGRSRDSIKVAITDAGDEDTARAWFGNMRRAAREHLGVRLDFLAAVATNAPGGLAAALANGLDGGAAATAGAAMRGPPNPPQSPPLRAAAARNSVL